MWLRTSAPSDLREEFVIVPHHPDRLARPPARPGAITPDRWRQALTWNVFRTLELLNPAFWLRRFHVRLTGEPPPPAAQMLRVSLWQPLPLPPVQRIDGGRAAPVADVLLESEHAIWTLMVGRDLASTESGDGGIASLVDAGAWLAGARRHYCGIIDDDEASVSTGESWKQRYGRSRSSVHIRSSTRGPARPALAGFGTLRWGDLAAVLEDCEEAASLPVIERALAQHALGWLRRAGIQRRRQG